MEVRVEAAESITVQGRYWFGDPCYITDNKNPVHDKIWDDFCGAMFPDSMNGNSIEGIATWGDHKFLYHSTAFGDGSYPAYGPGVRFDCGVDAGMLALIPVELIEAMGTMEECKDLGMFVEFTSPTLVMTDDRSNWSGGISCETDDDGSEDEDEEESYDDEDYGDDD